MFESCVIRGRRFAPARFCAPLAGYTHSAYRRLLAELGGCGAMWTEMLAARQILGEDFARSPWLRQRPQDPPAVYQLMVRAGDPLDRILDRLGAHGVQFIDLNLACDAFSIRNCEAGSALFENLAALRSVLQDARRHWPGQLTAKIRLGSRRPEWRERFVERLRLIEDSGLDAVTLHPRFFEDKFKRRAQIELFPWATSLTRLPVIANGDLTSANQVAAAAQHLAPARAIMLGRIAIVQPWIFACWERQMNCPERTGPPPTDPLQNPPGTEGEPPAPAVASTGPAVDHGEIWTRLCCYIAEDFAPATALRRIQMFTKYFAANLRFGHEFQVRVGRADSVEAALQTGEEFFSRPPAILDPPSLAQF